MRIYALITDAYGRHGGIAAYNKDLLTAFLQLPEVTDVTAAPRLISHALETMPVGLTYRTKAASGVAGFLKTIARDLGRIARCDMIYCGHLNLAPLAWALGRMFRLPVLGALYGIEAWQPSQRRMTAWASKRLDHYYAISDFTRDRFIGWSGVAQERITLLPNAIHLQDYAPGEKSEAMAQRYGLQGRKVLLTFGRLVSQQRAKGFDEVLNILPTLIERDPKIAYVIAGDGDDRSRLKARVTALGVDGHVVFTGFVDEAEKADLYRLADLYVMPSRGEGFGFVFLEAMASGVPVVASSTDGSRDAVRDGALGQMVDPDDPHALLDAVAKGLAAPRGVPDGLDYFAFGRFVERVGSIVDKVVKR
ncbi:MAG: glycosyltransferase family 4 protein [Minwuia sp.]|nr:glycosyltransferase family 4 protein [Minwuia sp.]